MSSTVRESDVVLTVERPSEHGPVGAEAPRGRWHARGTVVAAVLVVAVFALLAYERRWISDDGVIVVREVRQILAGNGPNYNPFQRDEVDTSVLWTWLLAAFAMVFRGDVAVDAVALGLVFSVVGLAFALAGAVAFQRSRGATGLLFPVGALVPIAVFAFWDFATSGLETGLCLLWLGATWWAMVTVGEGDRARKVMPVVVLIGLGPLVRPDLALATVVFCLGVLLVLRPGWWRAVGYCAAGAFPPVAYEIFRLGYYGITVPMPALAKEASTSVWSRGFDYLNDFIGTYQFWIVIALVCVIATRMLARPGTPEPGDDGEPRFDRRAIALFGGPVLAGLLLGAYVVKVGGDYMHGRMWIPVVFALLLPVMVVPIGRGRRTETGAVALLVVWALVMGLTGRTSYGGFSFGPNGMTDERSYEVLAYGEANPTTTDSRLRDNNLKPELALMTAGGARLLVMSSGVAANGPLWTIQLSSAIPDHIGFFYDNMGITAAVMPLDGTVVDVNGLASPLAGHLLMDQRGRPGHEKWLPAAWVLAEYAQPGAIADMPDTKDVTKAQVLAARRALSCGRLKDLMDSVDAPMSAGRFWANLTGAIGRTSLRVPADPFAAEREFCG